MKKACLFCGELGKLTKEHVWGKWIGRVLRQRYSTTEPVMNVSTFDAQVDRAWPTVDLDHQARIACQDRCNRGWMGRLEASVAPIITPMIGGSPRVLSHREHVVLSRWAVKTAMVIDLHQSKRMQRYFTPGERLGLVNDEAVPMALGARVWIGQYIGPENGIGTLSTNLLAAPDAAALAHLSTSTIGQFALQVLVERSSVGQARQPTRIGPWDSCLITVWPPPAFADIERCGTSRPPPLGIPRDGVMRLFDRFAAPGFEGSQYRTGRPI